MDLETIDSVHELGRAAFAELQGPADFPFLRYEFLAAFEDSGCLGAARGWIPRHLVIRRGRELVAFVPGYLKTNSFGEFVFDHSIAEFAETRLGLRYFPKWVFAVPFTPATGPRVLFRIGLDDDDREAVYELLTGALPELCERLGLSSAHVLFTDEAQTRAFVRFDWAERSGVQFQFQNRRYADFEEFLGSFRAKRRHAIRRERRAVEESARIELLTGASLSALPAELAYELYLTTVDKFVWGRRYLTLDFFRRVLETMPDAIHFVLAREANGKPLAGAFNLLGSEALYGRYWGAFREVPYLHFEVCLYRGLEETIRRGLARFEPGAGGEHKESRGFSATRTTSVHHFADRRLDAIVRDFYRRESEALELRVAEGSAHSD